MARTGYVPKLLPRYVLSGLTWSTAPRAPLFDGGKEAPRRLYTRSQFCAETRFAPVGRVRCWKVRFKTPRICCRRTHRQDLVAVDVPRPYSRAGLSDDHARFCAASKTGQWSVSPGFQENRQKLQRSMTRQLPRRAGFEITRGGGKTGFHFLPRACHKVDYQAKSPGFRNRECEISPVDDPAACNISRCGACTPGPRRGGSDDRPDCKVLSRQKKKKV